MTRGRPIKPGRLTREELAGIIARFLREEIGPNAMEARFGDGTVDAIQGTVQELALAGFRRDALPAARRLVDELDWADVLKPETAGGPQ